MEEAGTTQHLDRGICHRFGHEPRTSKFRNLSIDAWLFVGRVHQWHLQDCGLRRFRSVASMAVKGSTAANASPHKSGAAVHAEAEASLANSMFTIPPSTNAEL
jgi:hypothetical protein